MNYFLISLVKIKLLSLHEIFAKREMRVNFRDFTAGMKLTNFPATSLLREFDSNVFSSSKSTVLIVLEGQKFTKFHNTVRIAEFDIQDLSKIDFT